MKTAPTNENARRQPGVIGKANGTEQRQFATSNKRHQRALALLLRRPAKREELDHIAGCSNFPDLAAELRRRGLEIPCQRVSAFDRDGQEVKAGVYRLTNADRLKVARWLAARGAR